MDISSSSMQKRRCCCQWRGLLALLLALASCFPAAQPAPQVAEQLYPGYTVLQPATSSTSSIAAAIAEARTDPSAPTKFLVVLANNNKPILADKPLTIGPDESWVLATAAGLQAAADGAALKPEELLPVRCSALAKGTFITNSEPFAALELLGLSINGCPSSALVLSSGQKLLLSNTHLKGSNAEDLAEDGGAALLKEINEVAFVNSACTGNYVLYNGGCVNGQKLGQFTALNSSFTNNWKSDTEAGGRLKGGGALYFEALGPVTITNCDFADNSALYGSGGSLFCSYCGDVLVANSRFTNSSAANSGQGGCIYAGEVASLNVVDCTLTDNGLLPGSSEAATGNGGAIATDGTRTSNVYPVNLIVRRSKFVGNTAAVGGAIFAAQFASGKGRVEVHECMFTNNTGYYDGGAIMIEENQYTQLLLNASQFEGNSGEYGGAVSAYDADVKATGCTFTQNKADTEGGALQLTTTQAAGSGNVLSLAGCTFNDNSAGIYGGAVAVYGQGLAVTNSSFTANIGGSAGAIYLYNAATAELSDSAFESNTAEKGTAGAVRLDTVGHLSMRDITMMANEAWGGNGGAMQAAQVSSAMLTGLTVTDCYASAAGGAVSFLASTNVTLQSSTLFNNTAPLGAGLAADSSQLALRGVNISSNLAVEEEETEEGGRRRRRLQQAAAPADDASTVRPFGSEVYASTTGGAILVQSTSLSIADSMLAGNTAGGDAGALFAQAPTGLDISNVTFADNVAERGVGAAAVLRGAGAAVAAGAKDCSFTGNTAKLGNGGAVVIDSGLGALEVACEGCRFESNKAGRNGGAIAAAGPTSLTCTDCQSTANEAGQHGGWLHCNGCSSASITAGSSSSNKAGAAGGSVSCVDCGKFTTQQYDYRNNVAGSGGAVAVQTAAAVAVSDCRIESNSAGNTTQDAVTSPLVRRVYALPPAWQAMYGVGSATAGLGCGAHGAGGGLCMSGAGAASISANSITGNRGSTGGALFASADCEAAVGGCRPGQVNVTDLTARDNSATEAGGVLYTTTPAALHIGDAGADPASAAAAQRQQQIVQQLSQSNSVGEGGYGPAVASFPNQLSLVYPLNDELLDAFSVASYEAEADKKMAVQQQPKQGGAGRKLQQVPLPTTDQVAAAVKGATSDLKRQVDSTYQTTSSPEAGTSDTLQPFCPALGAAIMGRHTMSIGSNQNFSIPINVLDAFGSKARRGPGSNWIVALSQSSGDTRQLSGNMRGALSGGYVVLQGLSIQAQPGSKLNLTLSAVPPPGSGDKPLSANIAVLVRPCVAGEYAIFTRDIDTTGQRSITDVSCRTCAAPLFSFSAYPAPGSTETASENSICQSCPDRGVCVAGMVIPESGAFQVHPRSTVIRRCPNVRACQRNNTATINLQGLQCANRRYIDPADIDPRPYTAMQCSRGYAGPFCSSCYRPGRNKWLLQQLDRSVPHDPGFTIGDQIVIAAGQADITAGRNEVYGMKIGRCERCPHMVVSWVGFLLSRVLDLLVVGLIALLWLFYGWLSKSAAATAFVQMKHQRMIKLKMRDSVFGTMLSSKTGIAMTQSLNRVLSAAGGGSGSALATRSSTLSREMRHQQSTAHRGSAPRQLGSPPLEHAPLPMQPSVTQQSSETLPPVMEAPHGSRIVPPSAAAESYASAFSLVEQPSVQHALRSELSSSSSLQGGLGGPPGSGGLYHIYHQPSMRWSSAVDVVNLLKQQYMHGGHQTIEPQGSIDNDVLAQQAALMLMAVKHLACLAQVVLDGAQIAAVLLSMDLMFLAPDWAAKALAAVLLTQAHTWQYVPFECLIPGRSESSAAVAQTVLVMLLPIIYTLVLSPTLLWLLDRSQDSALFRQYVLAGAAAPTKDDPAQPNAAGTAAAAAKASWWHRFWPAKSGTWTLFVAVAVASMAYCYSFYVANLTAAFNCMSLSTKQAVPGEYEVTRSVWVPDMQISCSSGPQVAAMAAAILVGIPMLIGYWLLLLTLAWPKQAASPAPVKASKAGSRILRALSNYGRLIMRACLIPFGWLERPVRTCQRYTSAVGVCGESCAALSVWNIAWRWWWLVGREVLKFGLVAAATLTTMPGPDEQARVLLLLVTIAAAISWRVQAGCSTSMNQLQFVVWCWLQLLALLVVIPSMQGISAVGFGSAMLVLVVLVMLQCAFVFGCLVWRIAASFKNLSLLMGLRGGGPCGGAADECG